MAINPLIPQFDSTPLFFSKHEENQRQYVSFIFSQGIVITHDIQILKDIGPSHYSKLSFLLTQDSTIKIKLPNYIGPDELKNFIYMIKNGIFLKSQNFFNDFVSTIQTSEFFQNDQLTTLIINDLAIKTIDLKNSFGYLNLSYDKIRYRTDKNISIDKAWHHLFFSSLNLISNNLIGVLKNDELTIQINQLDKKIKEEIILRAIHLYYNSEAMFEDSEDMILLINFIGNLRRKINFFEVLSHEYLFLISEAMNDKSWRGDYAPAFHVDLYKNMQNVYEEYEIDYSIQKLVISLEYNCKNDTLTMKLKLKEDKEAKLKIMTFISQAVIENQPLAPMINTISCDKTMITLLNATDLSSKYNIIRNNSIQFHQVYQMKEVLPLKATIETNGVIQLVNGLNSQLFRNDYLQITLRLKICYVYSFLSTFLLDNFGLFFGDDKVPQLAYNLLCALIRNIGDQTHNNNKALMLLNWRMILYNINLIVVGDERNGTDDLDDIFKTIKWGDVDMKVLFEIIVMINDRNQGFLREIIMQEEYSTINNTNFIKKILCMINIYNSIVIGKKIDYAKLIGINNKIKVHLGGQNDNDDNHSDKNTIGKSELYHHQKRQMEKYDFSYTISKAIKVINKKKDKNM